MPSQVKEEEQHRQIHTLMLTLIVAEQQLEMKQLDSAAVVVVAALAEALQVWTLRLLLLLLNHLLQRYHQLFLALIQHFV